MSLDRGVMRKYEAVLFDLDGVLVDACDWHYDALNEALMEVVGYTISRQDHIQKYNGLPTAVKLRMLNIDSTSASIIEAYKQEKTLKIINERAKIMPEKQELHSYLKDQGTKIACVTNSIGTTATAMLERTGQMQFIDLLVSNGDVEKNKPHPDCYNFAIQKLKVDPYLCMCVEDSPKGIEAAINSRVSTVWQVKDPSEVILKNYRRFVDENSYTNGG